MIIRKPYAFLIKHFRKIHIVLFALAVYIYFKTTQTYSFVNEFINLSAYDSYNEPISKYVSIFAILCLLVLIVGSTSLMFLLRHKEKPWKAYLVPVIQYSIILVSFLAIRGYFNGYSGTESTTGLRVWKDLLLMSQFAQLAVFIVFIIRIFGIDLNKFNFKLDQEYLELDQSDREELEININIDKDAFKRGFKKFKRNFYYFYQEHKLLCRLAILIFLLIVGRNTYNYISTHRSFKQGDTFTINGYTIKINDSYYSDKSYNGELISKKSGFVVVDLSITNNMDRREVNLDKYHIINGVSNYTTTEKTYETEFKDLGKTYESLTLKKDETKRLILIYKVDKKLKKNRFVLYYQEVNFNTSFMRKIKLKIKDLSEVKVKDTLELGDSLDLAIKNTEEIVSLDEYEISPTFNYTYRVCTSANCNSTILTYNAPIGYKALIIRYGSDTYEPDEMSSFVKEYGKITYTKNGKEKTMDIVNALNNTYYGKLLYIRIPDEVVESPKINIEFTIRNNKYVYKIKES